MIAAALALALLIGVSLGLLGGGGSMLTLPILTEVAGMEIKAAIASSLFVVGLTSVAGAIAHARAGRIQWRTGLWFGAAGMIGAFAGGRAAAVLPAPVLVLGFAGLMLATATAMLRGRRTDRGRAVVLAPGKVIALGVVVGLVTGTVGAGGGFVVVPALVLVGGLAMPQAIGTSLVVIAMQSFAGLTGHLGHVDVDWSITVAVAAVAVLGSVAGGAVAGRFAPAQLRRGFGILVLAMALLMIGKQLALL